MNYTSNYNLNQWAKSDQVKMEDFNADNAKIDAALGELASGKADAADLAALAARTPVIHTGTYEGDATNNRLIDLGCRPKVVLTVWKGDTFNVSGTNTVPYSALIMDGIPVNTSYVTAEVDDNGFLVSKWINQTGKTYHYVAFA